jgi:hypothetical protein
MHRLALAFALVPALLTTSVHAQTVSEDVAKQLWCAEAFTVLFSAQASMIASEEKPIFDAYVSAASQLLDAATQAYLNAGFTEEQVAKAKADLVTEVTPIVTSQNQTGKYTPEQCNPLLKTYLKLPEDSSSSGGDATSTSSSAADQGSSASSAQ